MKLRQKCYGKRYCICAKMVNENAWSEWTQSDDINVAMKQVEKIRELGFLGKVTDRNQRKIITTD